MLSFLLTLALPALKAIAIAVGSYVGVQIGLFVDAHVKDARLKAAVLEIKDGAAVAVAAVAQTTVDAARTAAEDGKLPADVAKAALDAAVAKTKQIASDKGQAVLRAAGVDVEVLVASSVEAAVREDKVPSGTDLGGIASRIAQLTATP